MMILNKKDHQIIPDEACVAEWSSVMVINFKGSTATPEPSLSLKRRCMANVLFLNPCVIIARVSIVHLFLNPGFNPTLNAVLVAI